MRNRTLIGVAILALLMLCAGCGANVSDMSSLMLAPAGFKYTNTEGNQIAFAEQGDTIQVRTNDGLMLLEFTMGRVTVSLDGAALGRNDIGTLVAFTRGITFEASSNAGVKAASGLPTEITVFVPCFLANTTLRVCPHETTLTDTSEGCTGEIDLTVEAPFVGGYAWLNPVRTGDDDCEISGETTLFESFYGEGVTPSAP